MVQRVEAWGNVLEFPDDMPDNEISSAIQKNESQLNPNASTFTKAKSTISRGVDSGLSALTPKKSIADQATTSTAGGLSPRQSADGRQAVAKAFVSAEPVPEEGGFINSAARTVGQNIKGAGQIGADYLGADRNNAVKRYGQAVIDANPTAVNSLSDIANKPGTAVSEATGNAAPSMAGMLGARAVGQGITALSPLAGPAAPLVAAAGQVVSWLGPAAIASLPSYGGIRDKQILNDPKNEQSAKAKAIAAIGAAAVGTIEQAFGPQQWALAAMTKQGRASLAEKFAATTLAGSVGKGVVKGAAIEGSEELAQNPIEQLASFDNPTTPENLKDTAFGAAMGAIGGGVLGGGTGMILGKPVAQVSDGTLRYTAERGGKDAKKVAQTELDRRAKEGVANNAPESTQEAVDRIISTGKDKARDISGKPAESSDAIQSGIFDEEPNHIVDANKKVAPDAPTPEPVETLNAQINALDEGRKPGVLLTPGEPLPDTLPEGVKTADIPDRGTLLYRDDATKQAALDGNIGTALGYGINQKPVGATHAVTARDENGTVIQDVATDGSPSVVQAAAVAAGPKGTVEVRPVKEAMAERTANTPKPMGIKTGEQITPSVPKSKTETQSTPIRRLDHGELNIKGRTNNINRDLDKYKKDQDTLAKIKAKTVSQQTKEQKTLAKSLLKQYGEEIVAKHKDKFGEKELKGTLDQWSKWEPHKLISFVDKFIKEKDAAPAITPAPAAEPDDIRPLVESLIKRRAAANQINKGRTFDKALAAAKDLMAGKEVKPARFKSAAALLGNDPVTAGIVMQLHDQAKAGKKAVKSAPEQAPAPAAKDDRRVAEERWLEIKKKWGSSQLGKAWKPTTPLEIKVEAEKLREALARKPQPVPPHAEPAPTPAPESKLKGPTDKQLNQRKKLAKKANERKAMSADDTMNHAIIKLGGIHESLRNDLISDKKGNTRLPFVGSLFNPRGTQDLSDLATQLKSYGYFTEKEADSVDGGASLLAERLRAEYMGAEPHRAFGSETEDNYEKQIDDHYAQLEHEAQQKAEAMGMQFDGIAKPENLEINDEPATPENLVNSELVAKAITLDPAMVKEIVSSMGLSEGEVTPEFIEAVAQIIKDSENAGIQVIENREADIEAHGVDENASEEDIFGLETQTEKELKAAAEEKEKVDKATKNKTDAEEKARKEAADKAAIREKAKDSADNFVLGGKAIDEIAGQKSIFSRSSASSTKQTHGNVESVVKAIRAKWKNSPDVIILDSMDNAPLRVRAENLRQQSQGAIGEPEGFIHGGKVYIVASQMKSPRDVVRVLLHESIGHHGLRGVFGEDLQRILKQVAALRRADVEAKAKQYGLDISKEDDKLAAAEEVLSELAQSNPQISFVKRAIAAIRAWLRNHIPGFENMKLTDDDITHQFLIPARRFIEDGSPNGTQGGDTRFSYVWHGTPHIWAPEPGFPHGRPRLDKMGTGEGNQSFGWGWYSAENHEVANYYKTTIGLLRSDTGATLAEHFPDRHFTTKERAEVYKAATGEDSIETVAKRLGYRQSSLRDVDQTKLTEVIRKIRETSKGNLYHLDIPDSKLPYTLNWDAPLSKQPDGVKTAIAKIPHITDRVSETILSDRKGEDLYGALVNAHQLGKLPGTEKGLNGSQKAASEYLASLGIVGTKYEDANSRGELADKTHNFVIWDQPTLNKVALLKRNGEVLDAIRERESTAVPHSGIRFSRSGQSNLNLQGGQNGNNASWNAPEPSKFDDLIYKLQNKHIDLKRVIESVQATGAQLSDKWNTYLQEELFHGRAAKRTQDFVNKELKPIMMGMKLRGQTVDELDKYLHARHAEEANDLIAQRDPNMPDGGSGMTTQTAKDYLANLPADKFKALESTAKQVDAVIAKTRDLYVSYGLIDKDTADSWENMFKHYVPLMREDNDGGMGIGQGFSIKGKEVKHRTGSKSKVVDILANIAMQREKAIVRGEKNRVAVSLAGLAKLNPNPDFWTFKNVPKRHFDPATGQVVERADPQYKNRDNAVVAKIKDSKGNIIERAVIFNEQDPRAMRMAQALKNLDATQLEGLLGVSASITRYFAAINTQYNPVFGVVNLVRDVQASLLNLSSTPIAGQKAAVLKNILPAIHAVYSSTRGDRKGKTSSSPMAALWDEMQQEGGMTGYRDLFKTSEERADAIKRELDPTAWMNNGLGKVFTAGGALRVPLAVAQKRAGWLFDWLSDYNQTLEGATRLSVYKAAIDKGLSKPQAASIAKNISVNFNRKGQSGQQAGALYAFFNAAMQGTARMGETMTTMEKGDVKTFRFNRAGKTIIAGGISLGVLQALALSAAGFDDDEPPEFVRERSLIIPIGNKKYITIPMPLGFHAVPNIGRISTEYALGGFKDPAKHITRLMGVFAEAFNPIGSAGLSIQTLAPTAIDPLVALSENKDWTGKPIAKEDFNKLSPTPGFSRNKDTASDPSKWIAEAINTISGGNKYVPGVASPTADQIDYLFGQLTGGVGRETGKAQQSIKAMTTGEDLPPHKIPLVGRFYGDSSGQSSQGNAFYSNLKRLNEIEAEMKGRRKDKLPLDEFKAKNPEYRLVERANLVERLVSKQRKMKSELIKNDAPREQVKAIDERITKLMSGLNHRVKELKQPQHAAQ